MKNTNLEITEDDLQEIARQITEGMIAGIVDVGRTRIAWSIKIDKFLH
jgi:hypothetical protein